MIGIEIELEVRPSRRAELLQALESLGKLAEGPGYPTCLSHGLFEDVEHHNRFLWTERWADLAEVDQRMASQRFRTLLGAIRVLCDESRIDVVTSGEARPRGVELPPRRSSARGDGPSPLP